MLLQPRYSLALHLSSTGVFFNTPPCALCPMPLAGTRRLTLLFLSPTASFQELSLPLLFTAVKGLPSSFFLPLFVFSSKPELSSLQSRLHCPFTPIWASILVFLLPLYLSKRAVFGLPTIMVKASVSGDLFLISSMLGKAPSKECFLLCFLALAMLRRRIRDNGLLRLKLLRMPKHFLLLLPSCLPNRVKLLHLFRPLLSDQRSMS